LLLDFDPNFKSLSISTITPHLGVFTVVAKVPDFYLSADSQTRHPQLPCNFNS